MRFSIGDAEMSVGELTWRDCPLGSSAPYNVKKMFEDGNLAQERSVLTVVRSLCALPRKGQAPRPAAKVHQRDVKTLNQTAITEEDQQVVTVTLRLLERFRGPRFDHNCDSRLII